MATTPNQTIGRTTKTVQHRWDRKQKRRTMILHRSSSMNRNNLSYPKVLPIRLRRTQGNTRIPLVYSHSTKNRLEERMDRSHSTPYNPPSPRCKKSHIRPKNPQKTTKTHSQQNIHQKSHLHPTGREEHHRSWNPSRI